MTPHPQPPGESGQALPKKEGSGYFKLSTLFFLICTPSLHACYPCRAAVVYPDQQAGTVHLQVIGF